jgi:hypothetical protein
LELHTDLNSNGVITDPGETIIYTYDATHQRILRNTGNGGVPLATHVQAWSFDYLDAQGNPTMTSANIRQIRLTLTVRSSKPDPQYAANSGYRTYTLTSQVTARNLAYSQN